MEREVRLCDEGILERTFGALRNHPLLCHVDLILSQSMLPLSAADEITKYAKPRSLPRGVSLNSTLAYAVGAMSSFAVRRNGWSSLRRACRMTALMSPRATRNSVAVLMLVVDMAAKRETAVVQVGSGSGRDVE